MRFIDLFCGIGGFHAALHEKHECVFACDIDRDCRETYEEYFEIHAFGDIREWAKEIDDHELLCAGFPCQPFSKSGKQLGFRDKIRGTLFGEISEIIDQKRPNFVLLENVANLKGHDNGKTLKTIISVLQEMGYFVRSKVLSPHEYGIPHHRPRIFIIGINKKMIREYNKFRFPRRLPKRDQNKCHVDSLFDTESEGFISESEQTVLDHWTDFMRRLPRGVTPPSPTWSMEFGRNYSLDEIHPISRLKKERLCEELEMEGIEVKRSWSKDRIMQLFPPYIWKMKGPMPKWKRQFILRNRKFWDEHGKSARMNDWLAKTRTFNHTQQKFEWHVGSVDDPDLMDYMIHLRPSGIRVSKMNWIPSLVAMAQIPIIGPWGRRITPREAANAQSFPPEFPLHPTDGVAFRQLGNSVNVEVVRRIIQSIEKLCPELDIPTETPQRSNR
tara:strand:+ start:373 stop:1698 length:1326 start_codon:yes stop_codon:yes gene_type:complete